MGREDEGCGCFLLLALFLLLISPIGPCQAQYNERKRNDQEQQEAASKSEWIVLGEGFYERTEYVAGEHQATVVHFIDGRTLPMRGVQQIDCQRGCKIRISQWRFGTGTKLEKMEDRYKIELLEAEAK